MLANGTRNVDGPERLKLDLVITAVPIVVINFAFTSRVGTCLFGPVIMTVVLVVNNLLVFCIRGHPGTVVTRRTRSIDLGATLVVNLLRYLTLVPKASHSNTAVVNTL